MKTIFQRFPDICCDIFDQLDNQNLAKSKEVSVSWCSFINSEKFWWIRMIQKYGHEDINENLGIWRKVINRTPFEIVKKLAIAVQQFFKLNPMMFDTFSVKPYEDQWSPFPRTAQEMDS